MPLSKEEVLKDFGINPAKYLNKYIGKLFSSMAKYAKKKQIKFNKWKEKEGWLPEESNPKTYRSFYHNEEPNIEQLYDIFLQSKK